MTRKNPLNHLKSLDRGKEMTPMKNKFRAYPGCCAQPGSEASYGP